MKKRVIIIGAGIGGLATANLLAKAGFNVSVYEKNDRPGGRAGTMSAKGFTFDTGPSWYLMPDVFDHYFSLFGLSTDKIFDLTRLDPAYKVFFEKFDPVTITGDSAIDSATFENIETGAGDKLKKYVDDGDEVYRLSLQHFLYTNFSSPQDLLHSDILKRSHKLLRQALTPIDAYVSKYFTDQRLRQILEYPMVFLGSSPFSAPAIYSFMSALDFKEGVFYPKGGIYTIIEKLVAIGNKLGVEYNYNSPVSHIATDAGEINGITLESGQHISSNIVISNADLHFTETQLLDKQDQSFPASYWSKHEAGPSALLMYLGIKGDLPQLEHHNLFFVDDWKENFDDIFTDKKVPYPASLYICKPSASDSTVAPKGHENVFVLVPLPAGIQLSNDQIQKAADKYLTLIQEKMDIPDLKKRIVYKHFFGPNDFSETFNAWQSSALGPSHILRQSALFRTRNKSKKIEGLYYVGGSTVPGIGLPMCLIGAELVYKRIAGDKRGGPIKEIRTLHQGKK